MSCVQVNGEAVVWEPPTITEEHVDFEDDDTLSGVIDFPGGDGVSWHSRPSHHRQYSLNELQITNMYFKDDIQRKRSLDERRLSCLFYHKDEMRLGHDLQSHRSSSNHSSIRSHERAPSREERSINGDLRFPTHCTKEETKSIKEEKMSIEEKMSTDVEKQEEEAKGMKPVAMMVIFGDTLNNFIDGMSIGAGFSRRTLFGVSVALAILCQDLPRELGELLLYKSID